MARVINHLFFTVLNRRLATTVSIVAACYFCAVCWSYSEEYEVKHRGCNFCSNDVENVEDRMNEITHMFLGTLSFSYSDRGGSTPVLFDIRSMMGNVSDNVALPNIGTSFDMKDPFPIDAPLRYVEGHRYLIVLSNSDRDARVSSIWPVGIVLQMVDVDESEIERAWRIACTSEGAFSARFCRDVWLNESKGMKKDVLQEWVDFFSGMICSEQGLKASEVIGVLGRPSYLKTIKDSCGSLIMYFFASPSGGAEERIAGRYKSIKYLSVCIKVVGDRVTHVSAETFERSVDDTRGIFYH